MGGKTFVVAGDLVRYIRESKKLTQEDLASQSGISAGRISKIEAGGNVTTATLKRVFAALGYDQVLFYVDTQPDPSDPAETNSAGGNWPVLLQ